MSEQEHEREYGLVMPFVIVASKGGPYDDEAFTVGWEMGELDAWLSRGPISGSRRQIHSTAVAQADLLGMRHGYAMAADEAYEEVPSWTAVTFTRHKEPTP